MPFFKNSERCQPTRTQIAPFSLFYNYVANCRSIKGAIIPRPADTTRIKNKASPDEYQWPPPYSPPELLSESMRKRKSRARARISGDSLKVQKVTDWMVG